VTALAIVPNLYVLKDRLTSLCSRWVDVRYTFDLESRKEAPHYAVVYGIVYSIVVAVSIYAHTHHHFVRAEQSLGPWVR
jgi:hypothetical protein